MHNSTNEALKKHNRELNKIIGLASTTNNTCSVKVYYILWL